MKINYRPEIDGLRAIAVISVIFYHAQIELFNHKLFLGGFIGVDIFFVISGYLITSIILKELHVTGNFSFSKFYERRIRRILPALLLIMLASLPLAWLYLLPTSLVDFSKSILYSLGFGSNFYFHFSGEEYGAISGFFKPMLHTWSLSVEEQYYILFPIILLISLRFFKNYLIVIFLIGFLLSLVIADWGSKNYPSFTFYVLPTRGWELLAGSILAYYELKLGQRSQNNILNKTLPFVGLFLILFSVMFFNDKIPHPSFITLLPIMGVCLIIWFTGKKKLVTNLLSSKILVGIGLISYSLYLWHYPIFAYARITDFVQGDVFRKLFIALVIIILSILTYFFIERPARNKKNQLKSILIILFSFYLVLIITNLLIVKNNGYKKERNINNQIVNLDNAELLINSMKYVNQKNFKEKIINSFLIKDNTKKILIVGDSHSAMMFNTFNLNKDLFKNYKFGQIKLNPINNHNTLLHDQRYIYSDVVVFSYRFGEEKLNYIKDLIPKINDKKIIIMSRSNEYKNFFKRKPYFNLTLADTYILDKKIKKITQKEINEIDDLYFKNRLDIKEINIKIQNYASSKNILYLDKRNFLCEEKKQICFSITKNGKKIFYDADHYTVEGAKFLGKKIKETEWFKID